MEKFLSVYPVTISYFLGKFWQKNRLFCPDIQRQCLYIKFYQVFRGQTHHLTKLARLYMETQFSMKLF